VFRCERRPLLREVSRLLSGRAAGYDLGADLPLTWRRMRQLTIKAS
jgi:hypothetical protein